MAKWQCEKCGSAVIAAERIRKNNIKRYCLPCSELTGVLVERTCIATARKQAKAAARKKKTQAKTKAALEKAKALAAEEIKKYPWNLYTLFQEWKKLDCWDDPKNLEKLRLEVHKKRRGIHTEIVLLNLGTKGLLMKAGTDMGEAIYRLVMAMVRIGNPEHEQKASLIRFARDVFGLEVKSNGEFLTAMRTAPGTPQQSWVRSKKAKFPVPKAFVPKKAPPPPKSKLAKSIAKRQRNSDW